MGSGGGRCAIKASLVLFFSPILESLVCLTPPPPPPPRLKKKMLLGPTDGQRGLAGGAARACERGGASGAPCGGRQVGNLVGVACARYSGGEAERLLSAGDRRRGVHALRRGSRSRAVGGEGSRRAGFLGGGGRASTRPRLPWNPVRDHTDKKTLRIFLRRASQPAPCFSCIRIVGRRKKARTRREKGRWWWLWAHTNFLIICLKGVRRGG
mmetsp:Transcript_9175/g.20705  ORF Transcript_9175/g.20705 Transcript_9175/m.20705 type:complete len:211 (+) Transcript_9175:87-719(+)